MDTIINVLLDKINEHGIGSLSRYDIEVLDNSHNPKNRNIRNIIISNIKRLVSRYGEYITMVDMESGISPTYINASENKKKEIHIIEILLPGNVIVWEYLNNKVICKYNVDYEKLDIGILREIIEIINNAIECGLLEEEI